MHFRARLVIILLTVVSPLVSFEIPPFLFPEATARLSAAAVPGLLAAHSAAATQQATADWVARQIDARDTGRDSRIDMQMRLFDRQNRKRERTLTIIGLDGPATPGADGIADRTLVRFTYPNDIAGTSFLVWERPSGDDDRFLYLPALGRVRRISGAERQESFVGSDFTYEDIGGRALEEYTYAFVETDAAWTAPDRTVHPAWRLESRAKDAAASFPRVVSVVRKDNFVVVEAEVFNRRNEKAKAYRAGRVERVQGIWTALEASMTTELDRTRTELTITSARYNTGLTEDAFSRRELERGAR
jgi:hypothetical protein